VKRASPADLRRALEAAQAMVKAGIDFMPVPVRSDLDRAELAYMAKKRLDEMESESKEVQS
jgi:hypothetical protein